MEWILLIIVVFVLLALFSNNSEKKPPEDLYSKVVLPTSQIDNPIFENTLFFEVVGVHIIDRKKHLINNCNEFDEVKLLPEPTNEYDSNAIMIRCNGKIIGYIKEDETELVQDILKSDYNAYISTLDYNEGYINVEITIDYN